MLDSIQVKNKLSTEDIIKLCCDLQEDDNVLYDTQGHPIFNTCLHHDGGDSYKLVYFDSTKLFRCYTRGESVDIFQIVQNVKKCEFKEAFDYVVKYFGLSSNGFEDEKYEELTSDWDIFQTLDDYSTEGSNTICEIPEIHENILEYFYPLAAPYEWIKEGINPDVMRYYGIRIDSALNKIIIPHRDVNGKLVGIRGRSYDPVELDEGKKYMPIFIQGQMYAHPLGKNLFGLAENKATIQRIKKVFVVEAEKSVLQLASIYGIDNCFAVATCGSSFSKDQMNLLLELGVQEIVLGYDREFKGGRGEQDTVDYEEKLMKVVSPLLPYVNVSVIIDYDHLTQYKDSPTDRGKEIFEKLYHQRIKLQTYSEEKVSRRKK